MIGARLAFIGTLVLGGLFSPVVAETQEAAKVARIGYLGTNLVAGLHMQEAFLREMSICMQATGLPPPLRLGAIAPRLMRTVGPTRDPTTARRGENLHDAGARH